MKSISLSRLQAIGFRPSDFGVRIWPCLALLAVLLIVSAAKAYPPAPDILVYGLVKDQFGVPLANTADSVILQTPAGVQVAASVQPNLAIGVNYALRVPMDSGTVPIPYTANAVTNGTQYKLYVVAGGVTNLPIEMTGAYSQLNGPSQRFLQNLTLGNDANGDGIPDAWELAFLASLGLNVPLANINPNTDYTGDGRSLLQEYLAGNYPYQNPSPFTVKILSQNAGSVLLSFPTTANHTYAVYGSPDLIHWTPLSFTIPAVGPAVLTSYLSAAVQTLVIQTLQPATAPPMQFYRVRFQ